MITVTLQYPPCPLVVRTNNIISNVPQGETVGAVGFIWLQKIQYRNLYARLHMYLYFNLLQELDPSRRNCLQVLMHSHTRVPAPYHGYSVLGIAVLTPWRLASDVASNAIPTA